MVRRVGYRVEIVRGSSIDKLDIIDEKELVICLLYIYRVAVFSTIPIAILGIKFSPFSYVSSTAYTTKSVVTRI
jgi:hypothetical protein